MRLKRFSVVSAPAKMADMANTMDAAPRRPAQLVRSIWESGAPKGRRRSVTTAGRTMKVRHTVSTRAGTKTLGSVTGVTTRPSKRKS